jgi:hypothetical protein
MTPGDTARLLAACAMYDFRTVEAADAAAWHHVVGDLDYDDAMESVRRHYQSSTDRMMPAHVRQGVRAIREERDRLTKSPALELPSPFEDDEDRTDRARRGAAPVHEVIAELSRRIQDRAGYVPGEAMARLREITDGPAWTNEIEGADR